MFRCRFRALYSGLPVLQRTDVWFLGERVLWQHSSEEPVVPVDPSIRMLRLDLLSTEDRAQAILGYPADQLVLPYAPYPAFIASRLTPFLAFVPRVELGDWVPSTLEIMYTDAVGSVIREILPAAEDDEGIPFIPETVESVPRETVNDMVKIIRAFRAAYRRALMTLSCRDHRMIAVSFISFLFQGSYYISCINLRFGILDDVQHPSRNRRAP
ncbi:uncharacterized protein LOC110689986 [Chenopodium quinoa]|uniref:uncharacterized protein LOC110689986 n=1 Tax=Chenopodium quinoa TaxID=63459 RepID=UPI000B78C12A|nr:uncharacterized protein LOC110689986 [Chenopodium quinoa]